MDSCQRLRFSIEGPEVVDRQFIRGQFGLVLGTSGVERACFTIESGVVSDTCITLATLTRFYKVG